MNPALNPFEMRKRRRDALAALVDEAEQGQAFTITNDGKPVAVLIGIEEYETLMAGMAMTRIK